MSHSYEMKFSQNLGKWVLSEIGSDDGYISPSEFYPSVPPNGEWVNGQAEKIMINIKCESNFIESNTFFCGMKYFKKQE